MKKQGKKSRRNQIDREVKVIPSVTKLIEKEVQPIMKIKPIASVKKETKIEKTKGVELLEKPAMEEPVLVEWFDALEEKQRDLEIMEEPKENRELVIEEPVLVEWFDALEEKAREFTEFRDKSFKEVTKKVTNKLQRKDQEIAEIKRELEDERSASERNISEIRHELEEKRKLIQELQTKLGKIITELK